MPSKLTLEIACDLTIELFENVAKSKELCYPLELLADEMDNQKAAIKKYGHPRGAMWLCAEGLAPCKDCPMDYNKRWCMAGNHPYTAFRFATTLEDRTKAAEDVVKILKDWRSKNEK